MPHLEVAKILTKLYEMFVDRRYQTMWDEKWLLENELALYAKVKIDCDNYGYERDGNTRHDDWACHSKYYLHFVIHKYHRVYLSVTTEHLQFNKAKCLNYKNIGNHDSCYRDSIERAINDYYYKAYDESWSHVPDEHRRAPVESNIDVQLTDIFGNLFEFVIVERERIDDPRESNSGYFDKLVRFKKFDARVLPKQIEDGSIVRVIDVCDELTGSIMRVEHINRDTGYLRLKLVNSNMFYTCYQPQQLELI